MVCHEPADEIEHDDGVDGGEQGSGHNEGIAPVAVQIQADNGGDEDDHEWEVREDGRNGRLKMVNVAIRKMIRARAKPVREARWAAAVA